jgi:hypothetical protein
MKLNDMNRSRKQVATRALRENFETKLDLDRLDLRTTKVMLSKVRGVIAEAKTSTQAHARHQNPGYMKAVMMEQALASHYSDLRIEHQIMLENEEVQKSQVILAAQDMIDSVQKMVEQISKMKVEELPAVVTGVTNEIGSNEGQQFEGSVQEALTALEGALVQAKQGLQSALGIVTGQGGGEFGGEMGAGDEGMGDMGGDMGAGDMGGDLGGELPEMPEEQPTEEPEELGNAGRGMR